MKAWIRIVNISMVILMGVTLSSCTSSQEKEATSVTEAPDKQQKLPKIGIIQIVEHPSLNSIRETFLKELADKGYKDKEDISVDYQNAQGDQTNLKSISQKFVNGNYDLIVAIATPSAQAIAGETKNIPIVFAAVTDPITAGLLTDLKKPGGNITGTSDRVSAEENMKLALRITPDIKSLGVLYNPSETASIVLIKELREYVKEKGIKLQEATVTSTSEVQQAAQAIAGKVDSLFIPADNTLASAMPTVTQVAIQAKKPIYVGADSMVRDGGIATCGVNYIQLGKETAGIAVEILKGKKPGEIPVKVMDQFDIYVNQKTADTMGITVPAAVLKEAVQVIGKE